MRSMLCIVLQSSSPPAVDAPLDVVGAPVATPHSPPLAEATPTTSCTDDTAAAAAADAPPSILHRPASAVRRGDSPPSATAGQGHAPRQFTGLAGLVTPITMTPTPPPVPRSPMTGRGEGFGSASAVAAVAATTTAGICACRASGGGRQAYVGRRGFCGLGGGGGCQCFGESWGVWSFFFFPGPPLALRPRFVQPAPLVRPPPLCSRLCMPM